jgi:kumamolisin
MTTPPNDVASASETIQCALFLSALSPEAYRHRINSLVTHATDDLETQVRELLRAPRGDFNSLTEYALRSGLRVVSIRPDVGEMTFEGTRAEVERAFENLPVLLRKRDSQREAQFPVHLEGSVVMFFTSDEVGARISPDTAGFGRPSAGAPVFTTRSLARQYSFPPQYTGAGVKVGIVLSGGGFAGTGLETYFRCLGLRVPDIRVVEVAGARNRPGSYHHMKFLLEALLGPLEEERPEGCSGPAWQSEGKGPALLPRSAEGGSVNPRDLEDARWTIEGLMDLQVLAGITNGISVTFYIAPQTTLGLYQAVAQAVDDQIAVLSCSFNYVDGEATERERALTDRAFMYALLNRMTVCFSSGNEGSGPMGTTSPQVYYPASSPWVLCCGGTQILPPLNPSSDEVVWNETGLHGERAASGGGFSAVYPRPPWQRDIREANNHRGLPDVAGNAAHSSGVWMWVARDNKPRGLNVTAMGTSAAAPLWASVVAALNEALGRRLGFLTPRLYEAEVRSTMRAIVQGNNIVSSALTVYQAHPGWNACTGLGRPRVDALIAALASRQAPGASTRQPASAGA